MDTTADTKTDTVSFSSLPALHGALAGGKFAGVITLPDGTHHAVVRLEAKPCKRLKWDAAKAWAKDVGGQLPSRAVVMLLYATCKALVPTDWYWTDEPDGASYAWGCYFDDGFLDYGYRSAEGGAVAVRLIPLST
jgi:hypothetical protein